MPMFFRWAQRTVTSDVLRDLLPGPVTTVFEGMGQLNAQLNLGQYQYRGCPNLLF